MEKRWTPNEIDYGQPYWVFLWLQESRPFGTSFHLRWHCYRKLIGCYSQILNVGYEKLVPCHQMTWRVQKLSYQYNISIKSATQDNTLCNGVEKTFHTNKAFQWYASLRESLFDNYKLSWRKDSQPFLRFLRSSRWHHRPPSWPLLRTPRAGSSVNIPGWKRHHESVS